MKILSLNTDYPVFLQELYAQRPDLSQRSYNEQQQVRHATYFAAGGLYTAAFRSLGHEAHEVYVNNEPMQRAWAWEHGLQLSVPTTRWGLRRSSLGIPVPTRREESPWLDEILAAQIRYYAPDVIFNQDMTFVRQSFLREIKGCCSLLVGQHAATMLPDGLDWEVYDLVTSSFPPTVEWFRKRGVRAEANRLCFEPQVAELYRDTPKTTEICFVGSFAPVHRPRTELLLKIAEQLPLKVWGPPLPVELRGTALAKCYMGSAWGREMYRVLASSKISLNHHGDVPAYANNMRLYETTGVGTMLVTDWKPDLAQLFEPGREVVAYKTTDECITQLAYYLGHDDEREAIAHAGQQRTLREHTYAVRGRELVDLFAAAIDDPRPSGAVLA